MISYETGIKKLWRKYNKGFTLMELMVVVLIVGVLVSIALPYYHKVVLKSRAAEAINLLSMVRTKQAQNFAEKKVFFDTFEDIPGGKLTTASESVNTAHSNILKVGDYEVELSFEHACAISRYIPSGQEEPSFTFSISYYRNGLGCTGEICNSFPNIIGDAFDLCNEPQMVMPDNPPCADLNFDPSSCITPKVLSVDGCSCECPSGLENTCSLPKTFNRETCSCECDMTQVPAPDNVGNYVFNDALCQYQCRLSVETCTANNKILNREECKCECNLDPQTHTCICPEEGQVNVEGECKYCNGAYYIWGGLGHCCDDPAAPRYNETTHYCEDCPSGSSWDNNLKKCVCTATNKVLNAAGTACVCDTDNNWYPATAGSARDENDCCNRGSSNYSEGTPNICCPAGVDAFRYSTGNTSAGPSAHGACCTFARPRKIKDSIEVLGYGQYSESKAVEQNCKSCEDESDTWDEETNRCHPCPEGTYHHYNEGLGYSDCLSCQGSLRLNDEKTDCECDAGRGFYPATAGSAIDDYGCCNTQTSTYLAHTTNSKLPKVCCPAGIDAFWYSGGGACCTPERPYAKNKGQISSSASVELSCDRCNPAAHETWDSNTNRCECKAGYVRIDGVCQCPTGSSNSYGGSPIAEGSECKCPTGETSWDSTTNSCQCKVGYEKVDGVCRCPVGTGTSLTNRGDPIAEGSECKCPYWGETWDSDTNSCECKDGLERVGELCQCPFNTSWQGSQCLCKSPFQTINNNGEISCICPDGRTYIQWKQYSTDPLFNEACCPADRPFVTQTPKIDSNIATELMAMRSMCLKCPNRTDTVVNGECKSCAEAYPGQNRIAVYFPGDEQEEGGYSKCLCPSQYWENADGVCVTCSSYGTGYTYTSKRGMTYQHCCDPGHIPDSSQSNGCSQCPVGSYYSNNCGACVCNNDENGYTFGLYDHTNKCTENQCSHFRVFSVSTCECKCPTINGTEIFTWDGEKQCCYCLGKDHCLAPAGPTDPLFDENGCYIGSRANTDRQ